MITQYACGATVALRKQAVPTGSIIFLGDIADISAATEAQVQALATTPLMAAPAPDTQDFLHASKVLELLESRGIDITDISFAGARAVEIGKAPQSVNPLVAEAKHDLGAADIEQAVVDAITTHLAQVTGHHDWQVELNVHPRDLQDFGKLGRELVASAGRSPWTGTQRFQLRGADDGKTMAVLAKVDRLRQVVVATRRIERGNLVGAADVEIRLEGGSVPTTAARAIETIIGKEAQRTIDANSIVQESHLRSPLHVQRGEIVKVNAQTGGIKVSTFAVVQQNGALGDLVQVQTLDKRERFAARVSGWKQLEVLPTGASVSDYATFNHLDSQTR